MSCGFCQSAITRPWTCTQLESKISGERVLLCNKECAIGFKVRINHPKYPEKLSRLAEKEFVRDFYLRFPPGMAEQLLGPPQIPLYYMSARSHKYDDPFGADYAVGTRDPALFMESFSGPSKKESFGGKEHVIALINTIDVEDPAVLASMERALARIKVLREAAAAGIDPPEDMEVKRGRPAADGDKPKRVRVRTKKAAEPKAALTTMVIQDDDDDSETEDEQVFVPTPKPTPRRIVVDVDTNGPTDQPLWDEDELSSSTSSSVENLAPPQAEESLFARAARGEPNIFQAPAPASQRSRSPTPQPTRKRLPKVPSELSSSTSMPALEQPREPSMRPQPRFEQEQQEVFGDLEIVSQSGSEGAVEQEEDYDLDIDLTPLSPAQRRRAEYKRMIAEIAELKKRHAARIARRERKTMEVNEWYTSQINKRKDKLLAAAGPRPYDYAQLPPIPNLDTQTMHKIAQNGFGMPADYTAADRADYTRYMTELGIEYMDPETIVRAFDGPLAVEHPADYLLEPQMQEFVGIENYDRAVGADRALLNKADKLRWFRFMVKLKFLIERSNARAELMRREAKLAERTRREMEEQLARANQNQQPRAAPAQLMQRAWPDGPKPALLDRELTEEYLVNTLGADMSRPLARIGDRSVYAQRGQRYNYLFTVVPVSKAAESEAQIMIVLESIAEMPRDNIVQIITMGRLAGRDELVFVSERMDYTLHTFISGLYPWYSRLALANNEQAYVSLTRFVGGSDAGLLRVLASIMFQLIGQLHYLALALNGQFAHRNIRAGNILLFIVPKADQQERASEFVYEVGGRTYSAQPFSIQAKLSDFGNAALTVTSSPNNIYSDILGLVQSVRNEAETLVAERRVPSSFAAAADAPEAARAYDMAARFAESDAIIAAPLRSFAAFIEGMGLPSAATDVAPRILERFPF